jgi:hypothetical protein
VSVCDRTALILDIFSQRARTREGKLQVRAPGKVCVFEGWEGAGEGGLGRWNSRAGCICHWYCVWLVAPSTCWDRCKQRGTGCAQQCCP